MDDGLWQSRSLPGNQIFVGVLERENPDHPGLYVFKSIDGFVFPDTLLLNQTGDTEGGGFSSRPRPGSPCVVATSGAGCQAYVLGFQRMPIHDDESDDPAELDQDQDNGTDGDNTWRTAGGAVFSLKHGGAIVIESGPRTGVLMNPSDNSISVRAENLRELADGYRSTRGRRPRNRTAPETLSTEEYFDKVGPSSTRVAIKTGDLPKQGRRELTLSTITVTRLGTTGEIRYRDTLYDDGKHHYEGPEFRWGGASASENAVLGKALVGVLKDIIKLIKGIRVPTAWGPSGRPLPPTPIELDRISRALDDTILSTYMFLSKNPASPGKVNE